MQLPQARVNALVHLDRFNDQHFEQERTVYLTTRQSYARERPRLAQGSELGEQFAEQDLSDVIMDACLDLVTLLGMTSPREPRRTAT